MKKIALSFAMYVTAILCVSGFSAIVRPLEQVFEESDTILYGAVVASGVGPCGGKRGNNAFYTLRIVKTLKGAPLTGDIKICADATILTSHYYVVAGERYGRRQVNVPPDAVLLAFTRGRFYRLTPGDSPIVRGEGREAYAIGTLEPDMKRRFGKLLDGAGFWVQSD